jgi:hypothetical protein
MLPGGRGISPKKDCLVFHWHSATVMGIFLNFGKCLKKVKL